MSSAPRPSRERLEARRYRRRQWTHSLVGADQLTAHRVFGPMVGGLLLTVGGVVAQIVRWWI